MTQGLSSPSLRVAAMREADARQGKAYPRSTRLGFLRLAAVSSCLTACGCSTLPSSFDSATALDGHTISRSGKDYRLAGIRAAGLHSLCSLRPTDYGCNQEPVKYLDAVLRSGLLNCVPSTLGDGSYRCVVGKRDVAAELVRTGNAYATAAGTRYDYSIEQEQAQRANIGMWKITPVQIDRSSSLPPIKGPNRE